MPSISSASSRDGLVARRDPASGWARRGPGRGEPAAGPTRPVAQRDVSELSTRLHDQRDHRALRPAAHRQQPRAASSGCRSERARASAAAGPGRRRSARSAAAPSRWSPCRSAPARCGCAASGWNELVIATPSVKSSVARAPRAGRRASDSELVRVSAPSRGDSRGSAPVAAHPVQQPLGAERAGREDDLVGARRSAGARAAPVRRGRRRGSRRRRRAHGGHGRQREDRGARPARPGTGSSSPACSSRRAGSRSCSSPQCDAAGAAPARRRRSTGRARSRRARRRTPRPGSGGRCRRRPSARRPPASPRRRGSCRA